MARANDDTAVTQPEVLTLHWEGPRGASSPPEFRFPDSADEARDARRAEMERELRETLRSRQGAEIWAGIGREAETRGDRELWRRKLHAFAWVKMKGEGNARAYAERHDLNHATVRTWIADVARLAYQVGYRLHEDKLLLVGDAPAELDRLRRLVNDDASSAEAGRELRRLAPRFRGEDGYFHLNEGHVLRALGRLRESDETLREGLTVAEARPLRALLWNARGQTFWDCTASSSHPLPDHLERAEKAFRRAAVLDTAAYFPFVNLAQLAVDAGDVRRCEYWIGELAAARKKMEPAMQRGLGEYLQDAEWTRPVQGRRFWRAGPAKWIRELLRSGAAVLIAAVSLLGTVAALPATAGAGHDVEAQGRDAPTAGRHGGAGGN